jgi:hypothetical protein
MRPPYYLFMCPLSDFETLDRFLAERGMNIMPLDTAPTSHIISWVSIDNMVDTRTIKMGAATVSRSVESWNDGVY